MSIRRKPVPRPQEPEATPQVPEDRSPKSTLQQKLFTSDSDATDFTLQLLSRSTLVEPDLYYVHGLNEAVNIARQILSDQTRELRERFEKEPGDEDAALDLATIQGVTAALGAFDNTGPDHFTFDHVRALFKFCSVREGLMRVHAANSLPKLPPRPLDGSGTSQPMSYVSAPVLYVGDGAVAANAAVQTQTMAMNNHIWAHNRRVEGAPLGQVTAYDFRKKDTAIYVQPLADCGLSRAQFEEIVNHCESLRLDIKKEINKKWIATATAASIASMGLTSFMFIGNIRKKSGDAMKSVELYFLELNKALRRQNIPLAWQIKVAPFFSIEVTVTHSPLG